MEWEKKSELCSLSNNAEDLESTKKFLTFVIEHMDEFDDQAWDMFFSGVNSDYNSVKEVNEMRTLIQQKITDMDLKTSSYKTAILMAYFSMKTKGEI